MTTITDIGTREGQSVPTSFKTLEEYKKMSEIKQAQEIEENDQYGLVLYVNKIQNDSTLGIPVKKIIVSDCDTTKVPSNCIATFKGRIVPENLSVSIQFTIDSIDCTIVDIIINNKSVLDDDFSNNFTYTFLSNDPYQFSCILKTGENASFSFQGNEKKPKFTYTDADLYHFPSNLLDVINPYKNDITVSNVAHFKETNMELLKVSTITSSNEKIQIQGLEIIDSQISSIQPELHINDVIVNNGTITVNDITVKENMYMLGTLFFSSIHIGPKEVRETPEFATNSAGLLTSPVKSEVLSGFYDSNIEYKKLGNLVVVGQENNHIKGPHFTTFIAGSSSPLFQINSTTHDDISLLFDCYRDVDCIKSSSETFASISKLNGNLEINSSNGNVYKIDLKTNKTIFTGEIECPRICMKELNVEQFKISVSNEKLSIGQETEFTGKCKEFSIDLSGNTRCNNIISENVDCKDITSVGNLSISNINVLDTIKSRNSVIENSVTNFLDVKKTIVSKRLEITSDNPQIIMNSTSKLISYGLPLLSGTSPGSRFVLDLATTPTNVDTSLGTSEKSLWFSIGSAFNAEYSYSWYFGKNIVMSLDGIGNLDLYGRENKINFHDTNSLSINSLHGTCLNIGIYTFRTNSNSFCFSNTDLQKELFIFDSNNNMKISCAVNILGELTVENLTLKKLKASIVETSILECNDTRYLYFTENVLVLDHENIKLKGLYMSENNCRIETINGKGIKIDDNNIDLVSDLVNIKSLKCEKFQGECIVCDKIETRVLNSQVMNVGNFCIEKEKITVLGRNISTVSSTTNSAAVLDNEPKILLEISDTGEINMNALNVSDTLTTNVLNVTNSLVQKLFNSTIMDHVTNLEGWYFIGKVNTTDHSSGINENGSMNISLFNGRNKFQKSNGMFQRMSVYTMNGECFPMYDYFGSTNSNSATCSSSLFIYVYDSEYYLYVKAYPSTSIHINTTSEISFNFEGNGNIPNGEISMFQDDFQLFFSTNTMLPSMTCNTGNIITQSLKVDKDTELNNLHVNGNITLPPHDNSLKISNLLHLNSSKSVLGSCLIPTETETLNLGTKDNIWKSIHSKETSTSILNSSNINSDSIKNTGDTTTQGIFANTGTFSQNVSINENLIVKGISSFNKINSNDIETLNFYSDAIKVNNIIVDNVLTLMKKFHTSEIECNSLKVSDLIINNTEIVTLDGSIYICPRKVKTLEIGVENVNVYTNFKVSGQSLLESLSCKNINTNIVETSDLFITGTITYNGNKLLEMNKDNSNSIDFDYSLNVNGNITSEIYTGNQIYTNKLSVLNDVYATNGIYSVLNASHSIKSPRIDSTLDSLSINVSDYTFILDNKGKFELDTLECVSINNKSILTTRNLIINDLGNVSFICGQDHNVNLGVSMKDMSFTLFNEGGNINILAAGKSGIEIQAISGNVYTSGTLSINSALDIFTTGIIDIESSASLKTNGGIIAKGSINIKGSLLLGKKPETCVQLKTLDESEAYTLVLPKSLPDSFESVVLSCNEFGQLYWKNGQDYYSDIQEQVNDFKCKHSLLSDTLLQNTNQIQTLHNNHSDLVKNLNNISDSLSTTKIPVVINDNHFIGSSSVKTVVLEIIYKNPFKNNKYTIIGNVVSINDTMDIFTCCFKKLTNRGCSVIIHILNNDYWDDSSVQLHYTIIPN
jgi:hypothetical protein